MTAEGRDDPNIPAAGSRKVAANHIFGAVITALENPIRLQGGDQFKRRIFIEDRHRTDKGQLRQRGGPYFGALHRASIPFQAAHRGIAVNAHHQPVSGTGGAGQEVKMARMQHVKTAIGKAH